MTGQPGRAALGLAHVRGDVVLDADAAPPCLDALTRPQPRVEAGLALRGIATAMLDVSDGLVGDLGHILECSGVGALLDAAALPLASLLATGVAPRVVRRCLLAGGDDYELLFSAPPSARRALAALQSSLDLPLNRIGTLTPDAGQLLIREADGTLRAPDSRGYDHFA